jgi:hypothetical protein
MKYLIFLFFLKCSLIFGQKKSWDLEVFLNPFVYKIGDINKQFVSERNDYIQSTFKKTPNLNLGFNFVSRKKNSKLNFSFGSIYVYNSYFMQVKWLFPELQPGWSPLYRTRNYSFDSHNLGIQFGMKYHVNPWLTTRLNVVSYVSLEKYAKNSNGESYSEYSFHPHLGIQAFGYVVSVTTGDEAQFLIPQFLAEMKLSESFKFNAGFQFKFWHWKDFGFIDIKVKGYQHTDPASAIDYENYPLHRASYKNTEMNIVLGLSYTLPLRK